MSALGNLPYKRRLFVEAYAGEAKGNATEAARIAGYKQPQAQGSRLLKNVEVSRALEELTKEHPTVLSGQQLREIWSEWTADEALDMQHRIAASKLLGQAGGQFLKRSVEIDLADATPEQLDRIAEGEDPLQVMAEK